MSEWCPSDSDIAEANLYWTVNDAIALGPIELAEQLVLQDPRFSNVLIDCLERALAMYPDTEYITKVA